MDCQDPIFEKGKRAPLAYPVRALTILFLSLPAAKSALSHSNLFLPNVFWGKKLGYKHDIFGGNKNQVSWVEWNPNDKNVGLSC